jgi:hypothetical protein
MTHEYTRAEKGVLGRFFMRSGQDSPLDGLTYCAADMIEIGADTPGRPNRVLIAAYTGDPRYLTLHGNADPSALAAQLSGSRWLP